MKILHKIGHRIMFLFMAMLFAGSAAAQESIGYAAYDESTQTLTFRYGVPTEETYWATDNTGKTCPWGRIATKVRNVVFEPSFAVTRPTSCINWFYQMEYITKIEGLNYLNTSKVASMAGMFNGCLCLKSLDLSGFKTSNVTSMNGMFADCWALTTLDVSSFDTSKVKNMSVMFGSCINLKSIDLSTFNTSSCTTMGGMFTGCSKLKSVNISGFDTSMVKDLTFMFVRCSELTSVSFGAKFNTSKATDDMYSMFAYCSKLRYIDFRPSNQIDAILSVDRDARKNTFSNVPRTTVIYLPHGSQTVTDGENVVYSYNGDANDLRCPRYYSEDRVDIEFPYDFITHEAEYKRTMSTECGSVVLPYAFTSNDNVRAYTLDEEHEAAMWFVSTETVPAHTPFVFKKLSGGSTADFTQIDPGNNFGITVYATRDTAEDPAGPYAASTNLGGWTAKGYYVNQTLDSYSDLYYIRGDKFVRANGESLLFYPHRVTFHGTWAISSSGSPSGAPSYDIRFRDSNTTGIGTIDAIDAAEAQAVYDITGRQIPAAKRGMNIVRMKDGTTRKVIIK